MKRASAALAACLVLSLMVPARADDRNDPWWGPDKALHFSISAGIAATTYGISATQFDERYPPLLIGAGVTLGIGALKEAYDATGRGDPSWKDFTWDAIGAVVGLAIAWGIDLAVRGVDQKHPMLGAR